MTDNADTAASKTARNIARRNRLAEMLAAAKEKVWDLERRLNEADGVVLRNQRENERISFGGDAWTLVLLCTNGHQIFDGRTCPLCGELPLIDGSAE